MVRANHWLAKNQKRPIQQQVDSASSAVIGCGDAECA
jgi:hypothetical protein